MVWLSGLLPYQQCEQVFERIGGVARPNSSIWRQTQNHGERLQAHLEREQEQVRPERVVLPDASADHQQRQGISMDGGMVNIRGEGWKEVKVGTVFDIELRLERDPRTGELVEQAHGINMVYSAVLGTVQQFAPAFWAVAVAQAIPQAADTSVTADGAEWIWNLSADYFPDSVQIVDWYHATGHLADAATALYPDDTVKASRWYRSRLKELFQGQGRKIATALDKAGLSEHSHYFHTHHRRMHYQEFREQGYPIGSGTVESGVKQFKSRLAGPGMRWSRMAAERMLILRSSVLSHTFDMLWEAA
jgi:hypothetical protein